ncbi:Cytochrome b6-f complex iron-sulfur subunit [Arenibacter antarcticus]|uniref:Ubiquinol-cytochrome c reductase iron-sulfur subunit n=1 Tax=Arenibacter antarcticus TaxID=2040469 RepID=A0ABW5VIR9_9FLAO|nr:Rieske (2Fe-2S) protein [Arenibacter sp. H213]MCM4168688.1 (2Fe-2S)-binding protein [Arenibacter sp. H213]
MERKEFLRTLGTGAAFALTFSCLHGCSSDSADDLDKNPVPSEVDFTINLNSDEASKLVKIGGFILVKSKQALKYTDIVVAKNLEGNYVAASQICSHEQNDQVRFVADKGGIFSCSVHGSEFDQTGIPINDITNNPLKIFKTKLSENILRIFE